MLTIYNRQKQKVGVLQTTGPYTEVYDVSRRKRLNSDYTLTFTIPMNNPKYPLLQEEGLIECEGQFYIIKQRERVRKGLERTVQFTCPHIFQRLKDIRIPYEYAITEKLGANIGELTNILTIATNGVFTFQIMESIEKKDVYDWGFSNCLKALQDIVELYDVEFIPDNYTIKIYKRARFDLGLQYRFSKNIIEDSFETNTHALVTRMTGLAKDSLTIIGLSASHLTEQERTILNQVPGAIVNGVIRVPYLISQYAAAWATPDNAYFDGEFQDNDIDADDEEGKLELLEKIREKLKESEIPDIQVKLKPADLWRKDSREIRPDLGYVVTLIDEDLDLDGIEARVVEMTEYPFDPAKETYLTIANYLLKDSNDIIADLDSSKNQLDRLISRNKLNTSAFEAFARQAIIDINNAKSEVIFDERGIVLQDKINPLNQVINTSRGIVITEDGGQTARVAITGKGIAAEYIVGILGEFAQVKTDNLIAGDAKIKAAWIEDLVVGGNVQMGPNATISWQQITDQPFIPQTPEQLGALPANSPKLTYIGPTGIYTGQIATHQLVAGTSKIQTALIEDLVVGTNVQMGPNATISWSQVTGKPTIPTLPSYIKDTYIDQTTIASPNIIGGKIIGGSIESESTIDVTTDVLVGRNLTFRGEGDKNIIFYGVGNLTFYNREGATLAANAFLNLDCSNIRLNTLNGTLNGEKIATQPWVLANAVARFA